MSEVRPRRRPRLWAATLIVVLLCAACIGGPLPSAQAPASRSVTQTRTPTTTALPSGTAMPTAMIATPPPTTESPLGTAPPDVADATLEAPPTAETVPHVPRSARTLVDQARADLAARLGSDQAQIKTLDVVRQEMPLPDLGCDGDHKTPRPTVDLPAMVMGIEITLEVEGTIYVYRGRPTRVIYCGAKGAQP